MLDTTDFGAELKKRGFDFYTGVPCSFLNNLINYAVNDCEYVMAANEGDAIAIASGAYFAKRKPVVLMQNSGLTNAVSPLTSLNYIFDLPILGFVSLRGEPGLKDEPQHELMGQITEDMLTLMRVEWEYLSDNIDNARQQIERAEAHMSQGKTFFFVVKKNTFSQTELKKIPPRVPPAPTKISGNLSHPLPAVLTRLEALTVINNTKNGKTIQIATTGKTGRELFEIEDAPNNCYMVGSMGCASSLGLGIAMTNPKNNITVIDGDGALLMRMGSMSSLGFYRPGNLIHILLDNRVHDSTGGQPTASSDVDYAAIAAACSYPVVMKVSAADELKNALTECRNLNRLSFIYMPILAASKEGLGRPTVKPRDICKRLLNFIHS